MDVADPLLSLSTQARPPKKFLVDGMEYAMLSDAHLSPDEEATVMALFARHGVLSARLEVTEHVPAGKELARKVMRTQVEIFLKLTTLPKEVAEKLPPTAQVKLMEALQAEVQRDEEEDEDESDVAEEETS